MKKCPQKFWSKLKENVKDQGKEEDSWKVRHEFNRIRNGRKENFQKLFGKLWYTKYNNKIWDPTSHFVLMDTWMIQSIAWCSYMCLVLMVQILWPLNEFSCLYSDLFKYDSVAWQFSLWMKNTNKESLLGSSQKQAKITKRLENNCEQFMMNMYCEIQL